jgi:rare lipoprotein A
MKNLGISLILVFLFFLIYDSYGYKIRHDRMEAVTVPGGAASWYGLEQQGKLTADGERFDRDKFTAASRYLPFNTVVRVTNRQNGHSVEVRINDRGPYVKNRVLDVSEAAAKALDMKKSGVTTVDIEIVQTPGMKSGNW